MCSSLPLRTSKRRARGLTRVTRQHGITVLALSSRAFYNNKFGAFSKAITARFGYDKVLPMNTGAEAVETALKAARRWGYRVKGIPSDEAVILVASENFHGRTITIISFSCDEGSKHDFGPATPGFRQVEFGDTAALEKVMLEIGDRLAAVMVEPVQGEAGCVVPPEGYLSVRTPPGPVASVSCH